MSTRSALDTFTASPSYSNTMRTASGGSAAYASLVEPGAARRERAFALGFGAGIAAF
jgi:hypothetical protein